MHGEYIFQVSVPLDTDGFVRRECPHCSRQFKWHSGPANEEAENHARPPAYNCPLCGLPAPDDSWNTPEQIELIERAARAQMHEIAHAELESMFRGKKGLQYKRGRDETLKPAEPLVEPDDMTIVTSPCHQFEPVKIPEDHTGVLYCLVCGSPFMV